MKPSVNLPIMCNVKNSSSAVVRKLDRIFLIMLEEDFLIDDLENSRTLWFKNTFTRSLVY